MATSITKRFGFESAHQLPWHNGKCARLHGHSYILDVTVAGPVNPVQGLSDSGMVMDFSDLGKIVKPIISNKLDHYSLNDIMENPTAENMLDWIVQEIEAQLISPCKLTRVRLWETQNSFAEWTPDGD